MDREEIEDECRSLRILSSGSSCDDDGIGKVDGALQHCHQAVDPPEPVPAIYAPLRLILLSSAVLGIGAAVGAAIGELPHRSSLVGRLWTPGGLETNSEMGGYENTDTSVTAEKNDGVAVSKNADSREHGQNGRFGDEIIPPLSELVDGEQVIGDISWMLDFSIVGFAKSGTTFLMNYLRKGSEETFVHAGEVHDIARGHPAGVVSLFYEPHLTQPKTKEGHKTLFGLKSPEDLETEDSIPTYRKYFPETKLIVSLRHPVKWFESFYNFRQYHHYPRMMPPTEEMIGPCVEGDPYPSVHHRNKKHSGISDKQGVCTDRANYHWVLSRLGKTAMSTTTEMRFLHHNMDITPTSNKVFLMEDRQILKSNPASQSWTTDLGVFLGLHHDLPPLKPYEPPLNKYADAKKYKNRDAAALTIEICDPQHDKVRSVLVDIGKDAAEWISKYFVESPDVEVSSKELFLGLLEDWGRDPCSDT